MSSPLPPVVFEPIFKPKPWGGRRLATLLNKALPKGQFIGESWELVDLPGDESHVRRGPLAGRTLADLVKLWGRDLLGHAPLIDDRFPLLIKFLDACENLSVQVHPKPADDDPAGLRPGIKHEAWYVIHADPGAKLYIGLKPGVGPDEVARAANTPAIAQLLHTWNPQPGQCYYLPSGTPHALGAGVVVAEIQTPSDITYRLYDWDRPGLDGRPRELHIQQALANLRYDVTPDMILHAAAAGAPPAEVADASGSHVRLCMCDRFTIRRVSSSAPARNLPCSHMAIRIILSGHPNGCDPGDVLLIPAASGPIGFDLESDADLLEVTIPPRLDSHNSSPAE